MLLFLPRNHKESDEVSHIAGLTRIWLSWIAAGRRDTSTGSFFLPITREVAEHKVVFASALGRLKKASPSTNTF